MKVCFVCGNPIRHNPRYIGKGLYRHRSKCNAVSENYKRYMEARNGANTDEQALTETPQTSDVCGVT